MLLFTEGLSSQREIIAEIKALFPSLFVVSTHSQERPEIHAFSDRTEAEPKSADLRLAFLRDVIDKYGIKLIHAGKHTLWYEAHRNIIESLGVSLVTGVSDAEMFNVADSKIRFAQLMKQHQLPVVPSIEITDVDQLEAELKSRPFGNDVLYCVKPVKGIYGMGFWKLSDETPAARCFYDTDSRMVNTCIFLHAMKQTNDFKPLVLMPYLDGPERSVDMVVRQGVTVKAVARVKNGSYQTFEESGAAIDLAITCASVLKADGIVNVQTRNAPDGSPVLLEMNPRPSGGIGYLGHSGISLPALFVQTYLDIKPTVSATNPLLPNIKVRPLTQAIIV
ncbi:ATP-grasp domain-containing protein [Limnobaculum parvum]|uniref:Carbamoyl-phosphate synthase large chain n=1 Tax=Limnobaculum parvum TaxID=2172103 RepID=A0A2Y9TX57_9GAMM|nr:ATP-grasp domain-containing protein [Limnobaculum parvum]AWH88192.1 carbamoyl-phosphate synthase large chain [Limnobaculum parvum]